MSFRPMPLTLVLLPQGQQPKAQGALTIIRAQAVQGLDANGRQTRHDWRQSGRLLDTAQATPDGRVVFPVPYAVFVNARQPFVGIAPQMRSAYEAELQSVVHQFLAFEKVK